MQVNSATSGTAATAAAATSNQTGASQTVSLTEFMQLLSSEMSNQDPLQPMDPTQTMSQLAQFTSLQQMTTLSQNQGLASANSYLGLQVSVPTGSGTNATTTTGTVTGIDSSGVAAGSPPELIISGLTQEYPLTSVTQVQPSAPASSGSTPSTSGN
jgi:flagellar basal-body rod modification protein FlgD